MTGRRTRGSRCILTGRQGKHACDLMLPPAYAPLNLCAWLSSRFLQDRTSQRQRVPIGRPFAPNATTSWRRSALRSAPIHGLRFSARRLPSPRLWWSSARMGLGSRPTLRLPAARRVRTCRLPVLQPTARLPTLRPWPVRNAATGHGCLSLGSRTMGLSWLGRARARRARGARRRWTGRGIGLVQGEDEQEVADRADCAAAEQGGQGWSAVYSVCSTGQWCVRCGGQEWRRQEGGCVEVGKER